MITDPKNLDELATLYYGLFSTPTGQAVLADLDRVHFNVSGYQDEDGSFFPEHVSQAKTGERQVPLRIHELVEIGRALQHSPPKPLKRESEDDL